jgi:RNA polymerase sigma-70 factor (ECF subfamily)
MNREDDHILVRQCLQGDQKAFEEIVERYHKIVFNVVLRVLNDVEDAADVTQTVFLKAYESLGKFSERYKFFSWLYKIAVNESINTLRQRKQAQGIDSGIISTEKNPEEAYGEVELSEKIQDALMKIGLDYRVVIVLCHFQELSYDEISYVLDLPEKTVKSRLFTARKMLRDILRKEGL